MWLYREIAVLSFKPKIDRNIPPPQNGMKLLKSRILEFCRGVQEMIVIFTIIIALMTSKHLKERIKTMRLVIGKVKEGGVKYTETKPRCKKSVSDENAVRKHISAVHLWRNFVWIVPVRVLCQRGGPKNDTLYCVKLCKRQHKLMFCLTNGSQYILWLSTVFLRKCTHVFLYKNPTSKSYKVRVCVCIMSAV